MKLSLKIALIVVLVLAFADRCEPGTRFLPGCGLAPPAIVKAMTKMGPGYDYKHNLTTSVLRVSTDGLKWNDPNKKWLRLRY